jgi:hypothetical protein
VDSVRVTAVRCPAIPVPLTQFRAVTPELYNSVVAVFFANPCIFRSGLVCIFEGAGFDVRSFLINVPNVSERLTN